MIYHFKMTDKEKFESLCSLTTNLVGLQEGSLSDKTRKHSVQIPRMVASVIGRLEKIPPEIIADVINRHRTSIIHYVKYHKHNFASFPKYRNIFTKVYNSYTDLNSSKNVFIDSDSIRMLLVSNGVVISKKPQVKLKIKCGNSSYTINTDFLQFSNNTTLIRSVLRDYNYTLEIITI
tara:strand:+ start:53 stop:583 length:531 start_codon:yes stop_codon:yes gene_type:complete